jgi:pyridoxal phosphate enzyme (YggS family)
MGDPDGAGQPAGATAHESEPRLAELRESLHAVRAKIAGACEAAGRNSDEVTLIAITKTFPVSDIRLLNTLGLVDIGENWDAEAAGKTAECAALGLALRWHFVGQLQVNKCASVVRYADVVHSVDRLRLVRALESRASLAGRVITCLIQVSLDGAPGRGGALPGDVLALADQVAATRALVLGGVMAVAPLGESPRPAFRRLRQVAEVVRRSHPGAMMISAGMSADLAEAIAEGATHVRVGTALLGGRQAFVR